jgi:hypothetical protein
MAETGLDLPWPVMEEDVGWVMLLAFHKVVVGSTLV